VLQEAQISLAITRLNATYLLQCLLECPPIVERGTVRISEPIPWLERNECHVVVKIFAEKRKELLQKKRGRDDRGARIMKESIPLIKLSTTSKFFGTINQGDLIALCSEP
jgi:hypothetical protein